MAKVNPENLFELRALIKRSRLTNYEALLVVSKIMGFSISKITPEFSATQISIGRFMDAIKSFVDKWELLTTTQVTELAFSKAGFKGYTPEQLNYVRSHLGNMCRKGRLSKTYVDASESLDENNYSNRLFRKSHLDKVLSALTKSVPFKSVVEPQQELPVEPVKATEPTEKVIVRRQDPGLEAIRDSLRVLDSKIASLAGVVADLLRRNVAIDNSMEELKKLSANIALSTQRIESIVTYDSDAHITPSVEEVEYIRSVNLDDLTEKDRSFISNLRYYQGRQGSSFTVSVKQAKWVTNLMAQSKVAGPSIRPSGSSDGYQDQV